MPVPTAQTLIALLILPTTPGRTLYPPAELLNRTADKLDSHPEGNATFTNRMNTILRSADPGADGNQLIRDAAKLMDDCPPPGLADICADYTGAQMLDQACEFLRRRDGRTGTAAVGMNWMRAAG